MPSTPDDDLVAPPVEPAGSAPLTENTPLETSKLATRLPEPGAVEVTLEQVDRPRRAGDRLGLVADGDAATGKRVRVEVLDHATVRRAGVTGFAVRVNTLDGAALGEGVPATLSVGYSGFAHLHGAGYGDRLGVVALDECRLADPAPEGCDTTATWLRSTNNRRKQVLTMELADLGRTSPQKDPQGPAAPPGHERGVVLGVMAAPEGEEGTFTATPLSISGDWQVGTGSGEFSWNHDLVLPEAPAGPTPRVGLTYSSGGVDGMVTTRNTQAGPNGLGWGDFANAFIERRYRTCADDGGSTGDLCWSGDNATISLNGQSGDLVEIPGSNEGGDQPPRDLKVT